MEIGLILTILYFYKLSNQLPSDLCLLPRKHSDKDKYTNMNGETIYKYEESSYYSGYRITI